MLHACNISYQGVFSYVKYNMTCMQSWLTAQYWLAMLSTILHACKYNMTCMQVQYDMHAISINCTSD